MIIFPAIDLKNGQCVRLLKGDMHQVTVYNDNPAAQAKSFEKLGFEWLHIVDLDGALAGKPVNTASVQAILETVTIPVQLGGGIRTMEAVDRCFAIGVSRVMLGTAALKNPTLVYQACARYPGRVGISVDARDGFVATEGWVEASMMNAIDLALRLKMAGIAVIVFTDIGRDGTLAGVNVATTAELARMVEIPVIASGGVSSAADIEALLPYEADGIIGVIAGKALYTGAIDEADIVRLLQKAA